MAYPVLLYTPGAIEGSVLILTAIIAIYSIAKAVMRYRDNHRKK